MSEPTVFDKIVSGEIPSYQVWEDDSHLAFLTPWPNTPGFTVVIPKQNPGDNFLTVGEDAYTGLLLAARKVAQLLQKALGVERVGLVIEGEAVPHLHIKLIPMHGKPAPGQVSPTVFMEKYPGYLVTNGGPAWSEEQLAAMRDKIRAAA